MRKISNLLFLFSVAVAVCLSTQDLSAQVVPFHASGDNAVYDPGSGATSGFGQATHMGKTFGSGFAGPGGPTGNPGEFTWTAIHYVFEAANGDQICLEGGGLLQFVPLPELGPGYFSAIWSGEFDVLGGSGRFESVGPASDPIDVVATNYPFQLDELGQPLPGDIWTYYWEMSGEIDLGNKN